VHRAVLGAVDGHVVNLQNTAAAAAAAAHKPCTVRKLTTQMLCTVPCLGL
jgi:hypothetical protein